MNVSFYSTDFLDANTGYAVGWLFSTSIIMNTSDGGATWSFQQLDNSRLFGIDFVDQDHGHTAGYWGGCQCAILASTSDGGKNWKTTTVPGVLGFFQITFPDINTGYAAGFDGAIIKTTNGGESWTRLPTSTGNAFRQIDFVDANTGYAVAAEMGINFIPDQIYKTTDGGTTWTKIQDFDQKVVIADIDFITPDVGVIVGNDGKEMIYKTTDGGTTWGWTYRGKPEKVLQGVDISENTVGYAVGDEGHILKTTDAGTTWTEEPSETDSTLTAVAVANGRGYAVGLGGVVVKESSAISSVEEAVAGSLTKLTVTPNPAHNAAMLHVPGKAHGAITLVLHDAAGSEARRLSLVPDAQGNAPIDVAGIPPGTYFYAVLSSNGPLGYGSVVVE